jgi:hypothetical protein
MFLQGARNDFDLLTNYYILLLLPALSHLLQTVKLNLKKNNVLTPRTLRYLRLDDQFGKQNRHLLCVAEALGPCCWCA